MSSTANDPLPCLKNVPASVRDGWIATNMTLDESFIHHFQKHGAGRTIEQYLSDAVAWANSRPTGRGITQSLTTLADGSRGIKYVEEATGKMLIVKFDTKQVVTFDYGTS